MALGERYSINDVARHLGVSRTTIKQFMKDGLVKYLQAKKGARVVFTEKHILDLESKLEKGGEAK